MNEQNAEFLKERLFYLGFGDKLNAELEKNMKAGKEQFQIPFQGEFSKGDKKDVVDYQVDFSKSKQGDMYFVNKYQATLKNDEPEKEKSQTFYINKGNGVTAKEAYNMLDGRAVNKKLVDREDNPYQAWLQINFKEKEDNGNHKLNRYHTAYGFDLEKSLAKHPIKEPADVDQKAVIMKNLEKGNIQPVTFQRDGKEEKMFLEANPKDRNVIVYDASMKKQFQGVKEHKGETTELKEKSGKKEMKDEPEEKKSKGRKMSV
ncbi:MAG: hypothetical protein ABI663_03670 [Chryseolinea sp.]